MMKEEEEEAVTSKNNDDDDAANIYSYSDSDNNLIRDDGYNNLNQISHVWGTWEELLLTCAVKRHGYKDWVSVAKEVSSRSSISASAVNCRLKYRDLKRRFRDSVDVYGGGGGEVNREAVNTEEEEDGVGEITWLEELRSLRMAELRREVQRCDESILSLQLKVKKLEEEKSQEEDNEPDLNDDGDDDGSKAVRSGSDETEPVWLNRDTTESDHRSINESNSTASVADHDRLGVDKTVQANENSINPDPDLKTAEMSYSGELGRGKRRARNYKSGDDNIIRGGSGGDIKSHGVKSQPLIEIIKMIRSHPCGSVFEHRLRSQETEDYKRMIKQHIDIKTIEKKIQKGSYVSSRLCFYRDVKLLFTNAIVFFPSSSSESVAAQELLTLVSNEIKKQTGESCHSVIKTEAKSSVTRKKASAPLPLVVCKKKSSVSKKMSPSSSFKQKDKEKTMTTTTTTTTTHSSASARSSRRTSNIVAKDTKMGRAKSSNKKQDSSDDEEEKGETSKTKEEDKKKKKKTMVSKKKSVAEFLKRIKTNSPQKEQETATTSKGQKKKKSDVKDKSKPNPRELRSNRAGENKVVDVETCSEKKSSSKRKQSKEEEEDEDEEEEEEEEESVDVVTTRKRGRESRKDNNRKQQQQLPKKRSRR